MNDTSESDAIGKTLDDLKAAGDAARQVGQQVKQAGSSAVEQAMDVAHDAKARAGSVANDIGEKAASMAEAQKTDLADRLEDVAKAVHRSGEQLQGHQDWAAHLVERGAAELSVLAKTLRGNDLQTLLGDLGGLARRQPALFVGASLVAGFALTRVGRLAISAPSQPAPTTALMPVVDGKPTSPPKVFPTPIGGVPEVISER